LSTQKRATVAVGGEKRPLKVRQVLENPLREVWAHQNSTKREN